MDASDLDACYSQAWQGLYAAVLDGEEIANPAAWLALVTYRRAIDEHRSRRAIALGSRAGDHAVAPASLAPDDQPADRRDIAADLDDRARLRQLFEALRGRLSAREQQAATLCYLQGLSRADAAARMGVSESRMRKLMEGRGAGSPGVAAKMGALVHTIGAGEWCEEQGSLMRGFAYGILDPDGERHRLALLHRDACPACRAYVLSLRGLAAVFPPVPALLHWALGAGRPARWQARWRAGAGGRGGGAGRRSGAGLSARRRARSASERRRGRRGRRRLVARRPARREARRGLPAGARRRRRLRGARRARWPGPARRLIATTPQAMRSRAVAPLAPSRAPDRPAPRSTSTGGAEGGAPAAAARAGRRVVQASREFGPEQPASRSASGSARQAGPTPRLPAAAGQLPAVASRGASNVVSGAGAPRSRAVLLRPRARGAARVLPD